MRRDRLVFDLPQVLSPLALVTAMLAVALAAITESDGWMGGAAIGLLVDALITRVSNGLREE